MHTKDEIVNEYDIIHVTGYRELAKSIILKVNIDENLEDNFITAANFLQEIVIEKIKNEIQFSLTTAQFKTTPKKNLFNPMSKQRV